MKRTVITCFVAIGLILAGALQTAMHHRTQSKQQNYSVAQALP
jgi:hypothetical protein